MDICTTRYSSRLFDVNAERKEMYADLSTLMHTRGAHLQPFTQVYDDACDDGFVIVSHKTGTEATFALDRTDADDEGEIDGWHFIPTRDTLRKHPQLKGWTVLVVND